MKNVVLSNEDFQDFPIGEFPYDKDHTAMGEYQYVVENGYHGNWVDMVCNYTYNGTGPTWLITERDGRHFIESMRIEKNRPHRMFPTLEIGKHQWKDYEVSASIKRLSQKGMAGLVFSMNHSIDTLVFYLDGKDKAAVAYRHKEKVRVLKEVSFPHGCDQEYRLKVDCDGRTARVYVDDQELFWVEDDLVARGGKVGITADCPSRFADFKVCISEKTKQEINMAKLAVKETETEEMKKHPKMKLWKKIDLKNFGTSRQIRFGHLTGTDEWYVVLAQMQKRVSRDSYGFISCLTAIDLEGNVLWQLGEPSDKTEELGKVSADMAFQIYDIDGDGKDEVIVGWDFEIRILDGETGTIKKSAKTPFSDDDDSELIGVPYQIYAFERINPDGIRICNFRGKEKPADILIKDRYCRIYALDEDLNLMWKFKSPTNTGHCPLPIDIDGDGKDEAIIC